MSSYPHYEPPGVRLNKVLITSEEVPLQAKAGGSEQRQMMTLLMLQFLLVWSSVASLHEPFWPSVLFLENFVALGICCAFLVHGTGILKGSFHASFNALTNHVELVPAICRRSLAFKKRSAPCTCCCYCIPDPVQNPCAAMTCLPPDWLLSIQNMSVNQAMAVLWPATPDLWYS